MSDALAATADDVRGLYGLALRRPPESEATILSGVGVERAELVRRLFNSEEFTVAVVDPLRDGRAPGFTRDAADPAVIRWACGWLPVSEATADALGRAESWVAAYAALFRDEGFQALLGDHDPVRSAGIGPALEAAADFQAGVDMVDGRIVQGWARRIARPETPMRLELRVNGLAVAKGRADRFKREFQERFGGAGRLAFALKIPEDLPARRGLAEVVEPRSGLVLGALPFAFDERSAAPLHALEQGLAEARARLDELARLAPQAVSDGALPLEQYGRYFRQYRQGALPDPALFSALAVLVLLDATLAEPPWIEDAAWSVVSQSHGAVRLVIGVRPDQAALAEDLKKRIARRAGMDVRLWVTWDPGEWRDAASADEDFDVVLLMPGDGVLHPEALAAVATVMESRPGVQAVYFDEDRLEDSGAATEAAEHPRRDPRLKPAFDADLLLQTPYCGAFPAFRREAWTRLRGWEDGRGDLLGPARLLRLADTAGAVRGVAGLLASRRLDDDPGGVAWRRIVERHLADAAPGARVERRLDVLGAPAQAHRVRWPLAEGASATVIIPTRDRLDLLRPCVDSLLASRTRNVTAMDILVIDHQSSEPETRAYLGAAAARGDIRVTPFEGAFNWALMNNRAAGRSDAQVLVFLNNDTVVLSPDWLDELTAQALRPEVGAVGCRLIYEDGTIQHAGFVARDAENGFLTHEGVGVEGADGGYLGRHGLAHRTVAVTGACLATRREVFEALDGFDAAHYPIEGNDVDFCFRVQASDRIVVYTPYATLYHLESKSRGFGQDSQAHARAATANRRLWRRWGGEITPDPWFNPYFDRLAEPFARLRPPPRILT